MYPMRGVHKIKSESSHSYGCDYKISIYWLSWNYFILTWRDTLLKIVMTIVVIVIPKELQYNVLIDTQNQIINKSNND
jgi:hypothetical protein